MNICANCAHKTTCVLVSFYEAKGEHITKCPRRKPITNYDRIVSKSPMELAEWLAELLFHCSNTICDKRCPMYECCCDQPSDNIEDWLKQEAQCTSG